jgi:hypothetical protein
MGLGLQGAYGLQGGWDTLNEIIATRKKDELLAQREADAQQARLLDAAKFREEQRQNLVNEQRLGEQNTELGLFRKQQGAKYEADTAKENALGQSRQDAIEQIQADTTLDPRDKLLLITSIRLGQGVPGGMAKVGQTPEEKQADALERIRLTAALRPPPPASYGLTQLFDPESGQVSVVGFNRRNLREGTTPMGNAPPTGAQRGQQSTTLAAMGGLDTLESLYNADYVGPLAGRLHQGELLAGKTINGKELDPKMAQFYSEAAAVQNRIIQAITGAQMSEAEASRIKGQIPKVTDPPVTFMANLQASRANYQMLLDAIAGLRRKGAIVPDAGDEGDSGGLGGDYTTKSGRTFSFGGAGAGGGAQTAPPKSAYGIEIIPDN